MTSPGKSPLNFLDRLIDKIESVPASDRLIIRIAFFTIIFSGVWLLYAANSNYAEVTPTEGGSFTEGIIGTPRYVNPALAITRADQDMVALVYSGLMKISPDGNLENDVAESIQVSEDGLTYSIKLKNNVKFHDGENLDAGDIIYTIRLIQDPDLKSPLRGNWTDVTVEEIDQYSLNVVLEEAYAPFIENFTLGIMPAHAWSSLPIEQLPFSQLNTEPIGSGPFAIEDARRDASGLINSYTLTAFRENESKPKIDSIDLAFYQSEDNLVTALEEAEVNASAYIPAERIEEVMNQNYNQIEVALPRTFGIFYNQNRSSVLRDPAVREALSIVLNRDKLVEEAFFGHGVPIDKPMIFTRSELESIDTEEEVASSSRAELAIDILETAGWKKNELNLWEKELDEDTVILSITLRTSNAPLFDSLSQLVADEWRAIDIEVVTEQFEQTGLVQSVIRPRDFEALLFGHDMSRSYDLYPVWHSSQQDDPGLNVAQYANVTVDEYLETAREEQSTEKRMEALRAASEIIAEERPANFIAQPTLTYIVNNNINTAPMSNLGRPADRFSNIADWHTESDSLWTIFRNDI
jgi:peptide/nickel transport system substrate-binding protein